MFWMCSWHVLDMFRQFWTSSSHALVLFWVVSAMFWACFEDVLENLAQFWSCFGSFLIMFWACSGHVLGMFWPHILPYDRHVLGIPVIFWEDFGTFRIFFWHVLGIFQACFGKSIFFLLAKSYLQNFARIFGFRRNLNEPVNIPQLPCKLSKMIRIALGR